MTIFQADGTHLHVSLDNKFVVRISRFLTVSHSALFVAGVCTFAHRCRWLLLSVTWKASVTSCSAILLALATKLVPSSLLPDGAAVSTLTQLHSCGQNGLLLRSVPQGRVAWSQGTSILQVHGSLASAAPIYTLLPTHMGSCFLIIIPNDICIVCPFNLCQPMHVTGCLIIFQFYLRFSY